MCDSGARVKHLKDIHATCYLSNEDCQLLNNSFVGLYHKVRSSCLSGAKLDRTDHTSYQSSSNLLIIIKHTASHRPPRQPFLAGLVPAPRGVAPIKSGAREQAALELVTEKLVRIDYSVRKYRSRLNGQFPTSDCFSHTWKTVN